MKKAYKYRIYPTKKQADLLNEQLALCADLYNAALQERRDAYKLCGKSITFTQQESRRLVDRFGLVVCEALSSGGEVPGWVRDALPTLPEIMAASDRRTNGVERACTDAVEAAELRPYLGRTLEAVVVDENDKGVVVQLIDLAVVAKAAGHARAGDTVDVRVDAADVSTGSLTLTVV